jgi:hypothetical protein
MSIIAETPFRTSNGDIDFEAEDTYVDRFRDRIIALLGEFEAPLWLAGGALAEALGWVMSYNEEAHTEDELYEVAHILGLRAAVKAIELRKETLQ